MSSPNICEITGQITSESEINVQIIGSGPKGDTPIRGVDYYTQQDIDDMVASVKSQVIEDKNYIHDQILSSKIWTVVHNLDKYPSVMVVDSAETVVIGEVTYIDKNRLTITFSSQFSGKAYLN
jgi:hypothetical protein